MEKFTFNYKASPIDFETKITLRDKPLRKQAPPKISPLKRDFEIYRPRGVFSEFYGNLQ